MPLLGIFSKVQDLIEAGFQIQTLPDDGDEYISGHRFPAEGTRQRLGSVLHCRNILCTSGPR